MERDGDQTTNNNGGRAGRGGSQRRPGSTIGRGRRPGGGNQIMVSSTCLICQEPFLCSRNYKGHKFACWNCRMSSAALEFGFTVSYLLLFLLFLHMIYYIYGYCISCQTYNCWSVIGLLFSSRISPYLHHNNSAQSQIRSCLIQQLHLIISATKDTQYRCGLQLQWIMVSKI